MYLNLFADASLTNFRMYFFIFWWHLLVEFSFLDVLQSAITVRISPNRFVNLRILRLLGFIILVRNDFLMDPFLDLCVWFDFALRISFKYALFFLPLRISVTLTNDPFTGEMSVFGKYWSYKSCYKVFKCSNYLHI